MSTRQRSAVSQTTQVIRSGRRAEKHAPMRNAPLLNGPPASHGYPPQPPTKDRPTFVRTRPPRSVPGVAGRRRVMHPRATQSGTGPATGSGVAAAVTAAMTPNMMAVPVASMGGASRAHCERKHVSVLLGAHMGSSRRGTRVWAGMGGRTLACVVALAAQEDPPNPVPRLGPTEATDRAARSRARTLSGQPRCAKLPRHTVDGNRVACARARTREPPNACANASPCRDDRNDMRHALARARHMKCNHLGLLGSQTLNVHPAPWYSIPDSSASGRAWRSSTNASNPLFRVVC